MPGLLPDVDPDGLLEYSVVYTDRALNHMSKRFQRVMQDVSATLKSVYGARSAIVVPGSGSFGMESVARQFATGKRVLVIRNGWFSYRWSQIFEMGAIPAHTQVLKARTTAAGPQAPFAPAPIDEVVAVIRETKPDLVFAPHVETAAGLMLPHDYLRAVADAVHAHGGLFVLDCVASGSIWVDMAATGVDVVIIEIADGLFQGETSRLLNDPVFSRHVDRVLFSAQDALGALAGEQILLSAGLDLAAVSGRLTASPLAADEARANLRTQVIDTFELCDPQVATALLPRS